MVVALAAWHSAAVAIIAAGTRLEEKLPGQHLDFVEGRLHENLTVSGALPVA